MTITVNDTIIPAAAVAVEAALHAGAPDPKPRRGGRWRYANCSSSGQASSGSCHEALLAPRRRRPIARPRNASSSRCSATDVRTPAPTQEECRRYYEAHPEQFTAGERVEARHILFAIMPGTPVMALRDHAERTLAELKNAPERFAERAAEMSNCPSGQLGGNLGQFGPGEMVPEFDKADLRLLCRRRVAHASSPRATAFTSSRSSGGSRAGRFRSPRSKRVWPTVSRPSRRARAQAIHRGAGRPRLRRRRGPRRCSVAPGAVKTAGGARTARGSFPSPVGRRCRLPRRAHPRARLSASRCGTSVSGRSTCLRRSSRRRACRCGPRNTPGSSARRRISPARCGTSTRWCSATPRRSSPGS